MFRVTDGHREVMHAKPGSSTASGPKGIDGKTNNNKVSVSSVLLLWIEFSGIIRWPPAVGTGKKESEG